MLTPKGIEPQWRGETVVIICGGPSLTLDQVRRIGIARLEDRIRVIAIKDAIYLAWWADWLHGCDAKWWEVHIHSVQHYGGIKTTLAERIPHKQWDIHLLPYTGKYGFDPDPRNCRTGGNSGYQAIHCAMHAGAKKIITVGLDIKKAKDGRRHWFDTHKYQLETRYSDVMLDPFATLVEPAKERKIEIINCSPGSAVTCFRSMNIESLI